MTPAALVKGPLTLRELLFHIIDKTFTGEGLIDVLAKYPPAPTRLAKPDGVKDWLVQE